MKLFGKKKGKESSSVGDVEAAHSGVFAPTIEISSDSKKEPLISKNDVEKSVVPPTESILSVASGGRSPLSYSSTQADAGGVGLGTSSSMRADTGAPHLATKSSVSETGGPNTSIKDIAGGAASPDADAGSIGVVADDNTLPSGTIATNTNTVGQSTNNTSSPDDTVSYTSESISCDTNTSSISGGSGRYYSEFRDDDAWIPTKIPNIRSKAWWKSIVSKCVAPLSALASANSAVKVGVVGLVASVFLLAFANSQQRGPVIAYDSDLSVAFIGNSYMFVNDLPRLIESMSSGHMFQDSCLHGSGSVLKILKTGNGMYNRWQTNEAILSIDYNNEDNGETRRKYQQQLYYGNDKILYDFGACSVPQLLLGYDNSISYKNQYGNFYNDGNNPCLQDDDYLDYMNSFNYTNPWDFVVITDQSKRMCFEDARYEALQGFNYTYVPLLNQTKSVPVIVQPHAFNSTSVNMTGLGDVPTFTAMIYEGAQEYQSFLRQQLPTYSQRARIAPVGMAYLTVWEEDFSLWEKLFLYDDIHPTAYGSYLYGLVIYATIYNVMPWKEAVLLEDMSALWIYARKKQLGNYTYPDYDEAAYLFDVARRVALKGHVPNSLPNLKKSSSSSSSISSNSTSNYGD